MLKGRESLIRLIGKRRRFLPNRFSLMSLSTYDQEPFNLSRDINNGTVAISKEVPSMQQSELDTNGVPETPPVWVTCPVCNNRVRGEDNMINAHLDTCLGRGTKRKMSQRTLFQLNFCSKSKVKVEFCENDYEGNGSRESAPSNMLVQEVVHEVGDFVCADDIDKEESTSISESEHLSCNEGLMENLVKIEKTNCIVDSPSVHSEYKMPQTELTEIADDISTMVLNTFIVGRKFSNVVEINPGASVTFLRDPYNVKDLNAIKSGSLCRFQ